MELREPRGLRRLGGRYRLWWLVGLVLVVSGTIGLLWLLSLSRPRQPEAAEQTIAGLRCGFAGTGATLAFAGKRLNFTCGEVAGNEVGLLGDAAPGDSGWEIEKATMTRTEAGFAVQSTEMVWVAQVELMDGTLCAPTGEVSAVDGKQLRFSCPPEGGNEIGLVGEIVLGEQGWAMEKMAMARSEEGLEVLSSEMAQIAALVVQATATE
ncbi:MAG: hypothetical protein JSW37_10385 [Anaerolineales bacterium]|nr:MAG: hypothetical protein JSW37_10385 [Anaerolineales bacterium]